MVQIAGLIALWVLAAGVFLVGLTIAMEAVEKFLENRERAVSRLATKRTGETIQNLCHWFSESPEAMFALEEVGKALTESEWPSSFDASKARERWRERVFTKPVGKVA